MTPASKIIYTEGVRKRFARKQLIVRARQVIIWNRRAHQRRKVKELLGQLKPLSRPETFPA